MSYIPTNNSFSSLSELDLQWDDEVECSEANNGFWTKEYPKSKYDKSTNKKYKTSKINNQTKDKIHSKRNVNQNLTSIQNQTGIKKKIAYSDALKGKKTDDLVASKSVAAESSQKYISERDQLKSVINKDCTVKSRLNKPSNN